MDRSMADDPRAEPINLRFRVLATSFRVPLKLARVLGVPLREVQDLVAVAYFRELQEHGFSWATIAKRMAKSRRTIASIARGERSAPLDHSPAIRLRRAIAARLDAGALDLDELEAALAPSPREAIVAELGALVDSSVVEDRDGRFSLATGVLDLSEGDFELRHDALRRFLDAISETVRQRFFEKQSANPSFARVVTFRAPAGRIEHITARVFDEIQRLAIEADADATDDDGVEAGIALAVVASKDRPRR
jgi:transcriptional regulator with XRE-family HTH domain